MKVILLVESGDRLAGGSDGIPLSDRFGLNMAGT